MLQEIAEGTKIATEKKAAAQEKEQEIKVFSREIQVEKVGKSSSFQIFNAYLYVNSLCLLSTIAQLFSCVYASTYV